MCAFRANLLQEGEVRSRKPVGLRYWMRISSSRIQWSITVDAVGKMDEEDVQGPFARGQYLLSIRLYL